MSAIEFQNFQEQVALLSYAEQLALIEYTVRLMRQRQEAEEEKKSAQEAKVEKLFAALDKCPLNTKGVTWTREELHER